MDKTSEGLLAYARSKIGVPYVYGTKMQLLTQAMYDSLRAQFGKSYVWDSDAKKIGQVCCDCSGLISSYTGVARGSSQFKDSAKAVNPISTIAGAPLGALVWMKGHIGIYSGMKNNVPYYVAEDGSAHGCREVPLSNNKFTHWFLCPDVSYSNAKPNEQEEDEMRFNTVNDIPDWGKQTVQRLIDKGYLSGDGQKLDLSLDMIRILVVNDRAGLYK